MIHAELIPGAHGETASKLCVNCHDSKVTCQVYYPGVSDYGDPAVKDYNEPLSDHYGYVRSRGVRCDIVL